MRGAAVPRNGAAQGRAALHVRVEKSEGDEGDAGRRHPGAAVRRMGRLARRHPILRGASEKNSFRARRPGHSALRRADAAGGAMMEAPETPPRGPEAFASLDDPAAIQAQAAILLAVGAQMRGDRAAMQARSAVTAQPADMFFRDDLDEFSIPRLVPPSPAPVRPRGVGAETRGRDQMMSMAEDLYTTQSTTSAAALAEAAMDHPHELVRVAAAHMALAVTTEPAKPYAILVEGTRGDDELVRDVAATALARYRPDDPALRRLTIEPETPTQGTAHTSTLIHGTWAANGTWWPPRGDFWNYIEQNVWSDLYDQNDFYKWSGGYSNGARDQGADLLVAWIHAHAVANLSFMAHSHGTSVSMLASWRGVTFGRAVFLSSPVHPAVYNMNFAAVQKVVSIRVKGDLVLLADGSASRFTDPRYNEHVLPIWFNHSATHDPAVWIKYKIPNML